MVPRRYARASMASGKPPRARTVARAAIRHDEKLVRDRERLFALSQGGTPSLPIEVSTASLVEPRASSMPCPRCGGTLRVDEHTAETFGGALLRVARMRCATCGAQRRVYFRVIAALPS